MTDRAQVAVHLDQISAELADLRSIINELAVRESDRGKQHGGKALWSGVGSIQQAIMQTKAEIGSLASRGFKGQTLNRATDELDAVVQDTEQATETILASAETIDAQAGALLTQVDDAQREAIMEIHRQAIRIFEACNFQDISGQRISKVVSLMRFIELRVTSMVEIWGGAEEVETVEEEPENPDDALLNGPALSTDSGVVSQDDIDSLFA